MHRCVTGIRRAHRTCRTWGPHLEVWVLFWVRWRVWKVLSRGDKFSHPFFHIQWLINGCCVCYSPSSHQQGRCRSGRGLWEMNLVKGVGSSEERHLSCSISKASPVTAAMMSLSTCLGNLPLSSSRWWPDWSAPCAATSPPSPLSTALSVVLSELLG